MTDALRRPPRRTAYRRNSGGGKPPDDNIYDTRPTGTIKAILSPPWWVDIAAAGNGSIVQVHHPEHGWLAFIFPPEYANKLGVAHSTDDLALVLHLRQGVLKHLADLLADGAIGRIGQQRDFPVKSAVHQDCGLDLPVGALVSAAAICPQGRGGADGTGGDTPL